MSDSIDFAKLPALPQATFLYQLAPMLWQRPDVLGIWLEGSLARGNADRYSDVDLYVGVDPSALEQWRALNIQPLFGDHYAAHVFSNFSTDFFVYHVYLTAGGIYDLHVQPRNRELPEAHRLLLAWRTEDYRQDLLAATPPAGDDAALLSAPPPLDPAVISSLLVFFWINADKSRKVLYRGQDFTGYTGLHLFRHIAARLHFMARTGNDCGDLTRTTIHGLKAAALVLGQSDAAVGHWMGAPTTTRQELCQAQTLVHEEVARVGRLLAERYQIAYPIALEQTVMTNWYQFVNEELGLAL
ncbi:MAG: nucleotidyltransferase domain-containing protein [Caldilineaceae bacterium]